MRDGAAVLASLLLLPGLLFLLLSHFVEVSFDGALEPLILIVWHAGHGVSLARYQVEHRRADQLIELLTL